MPPGLFCAGGSVRTVFAERPVPAENPRDSTPAPQQLLAAIVESSDDAIISKTLDGFITSWNSGAQRIFGYTAEEAIGQHISLLIPADRIGEETEILARIGRGERIDHIDTVRRAKDGRLIEISLTVSPVRDLSGNVVGASKVARDIRARREVERGRQAERLLAAVVESSDDAIISKTLKGIITSWNGGAERLFGYTADEMIGQPVMKLIPSDRQDEEGVILARLARGERIEHYETVRKAKNGRLIDISLTISPILDERGKVVGASKIARDVSQQKETQRKLEEADQRKNEFLALLAHELRNPLGPIRHAVKILGAKSPPSPTDVRWATNIIDRQTEHMTRLVNDLLDVARITRGTIELRRDRVEVSDILKGAVESSGTLLDKAHHRLKVSLPSEPIFLDGDLIRLTQIVANLLDNAAKYTDPGGRISLSAERDGETAVIKVKDSGIGIAPELLPQIFEMFTRGSGPERAQGGLGVGLSLVDRLAKLHGGTVSAHSAGIGHGSEFTVRLPLLSKSHKPMPRETPASNENPASTVKCRVLVVDDNQDSADSLGMLLRMMGHEVEVASDGQEGIAVAGRLRPDIAILDIGMPKMNGYELAQKIREQPWAKDLVLVALTGWGQDEHRRRSAESGFKHHLTKPVDFDALQQILAATDACLPDRRLVAR
jgi:PAS domain S-box-containing protein